MSARRPVCTLTLLLATFANAQTVREEMFHGRRGYVLENDAIRLTLLKGGGHIAEARFLSEDPRKNVNPMRIPNYPTIEPYEYVDAKHNAIYGDDPHRWLSSGYMGHLLCFPAFGPPSSEWEVKAGLGNHGEAPIVAWDRLENSGATFRYGAALKKTGFRVERAVTLVPGESVAYIEETVENLADYDRPVNWMQHATFGPPFTEPGVSFLDTSGTKARTSGGVASSSSLKPDTEFVWPRGVGVDGKDTSLRPFQTKPKAGTYVAVLMDPARPINYFTMYNNRFSTLIGYLFRTRECPWIGDFQENQRMAHKPWNGEAVTRGIEFGTTPFAEGLKRSIERGKLFGVPTFRWIGAHERQSMSYILFLAELPDKFAGVEDVVISNGAITIRESGSNRTIRIEATRLDSLN